MTEYQAPGATMYATLRWTVSGLVGTMGVRVRRKSDGTDVVARTTSGIVETLTSGEYIATIVVPSVADQYDIFWDDGATTVGHTASEDLFVTYSSAGTPVPSGTDLTTVSQVKSYMESSTTASDPLIQLYITAASAEIERRYQRQFANYGASTRAFSVRGNVVDLAPYDLRSVTTLTLRSPEQTISNLLVANQDYLLRPIGGWAGLTTYTQVMISPNIGLDAYAVNYGEAELSINGSWGPGATPVDVSDAAAKTVGAWLDRAMAEMGISQFTADGHTLRPPKFAGYSIPFAAHTILCGYDRAAGAMNV